MKSCCFFLAVELDGTGSINCTAYVQLWIVPVVVWLRISRDRCWLRDGSG